MLARRRLLLALSLFLFACRESTPPLEDAGLDVLLADSSAAEASRDRGRDGPPPLAPARTPEPLPIKEWVVAMVAPGAAETAGAALDTGTFELPAAGPAYGLQWKTTTPGPDGSIVTLMSPGWTLYAAARVEIPAGRRALGRFDGVLTMYADGGRLSGDWYSSGKVRLPVAGKPGQSVLLVVQGYARGTAKPQVELFSTEDEVVLNPADATLPDLIEGEKGTEQWIGLPALNLTEAAALDLTARVEESAEFGASAVACPALPAGAVTALAFQLLPKAPPPPGQKKVTVGVRVESRSLAWSYRRELELPVVAGSGPYRRTFRSPMDGSAQYYAVRRPQPYDQKKSYALVLSLHGASVEASGQAAAYSPRDWAFIVAATNRRPYGFDWEEFGRIDALEVLGHAHTSFNTAPDSVYLTGHSMGGHGTNHLGVLFPGYFAAIAPSAGWVSFQTYGGAPKPTGAVGRARAASNTLDYVGNLARRAAYYLHGEKDDNVPKTESLTMVAALKPVMTDLTYFEQPGAGHWWDGDAAPGADCVDWPPIFDMFKRRKLDPLELEFKFVTPSPTVSPHHSFATIHSAASALQDCSVESKLAGGTLTVTTSNVRTLELDLLALKDRGVTQLLVDGNIIPLTTSNVVIGPQTGKQRHQHGPLNQAFHRPFCFVYPDDGAAYRRYAAYLVSIWAVNGNGLACALPFSKVGEALRGSHNLIYLGLPRAKVPAPSSISWDAETIGVGSTSYPGQAAAVVFPEGTHLGAAFVASGGQEHLLFRYYPFTSRGGMPDYIVWSGSGLSAAGFFTPDWGGLEGN